MRKLFTFRLHESLIEKVRAIAVKENRTLTNQIETVLIKFTEDYENDKSSPEGHNEKTVIG